MLITVSELTTAMKHNPPNSSNPIHPTLFIWQTAVHVSLVYTSNQTTARAAQPQQTASISNCSHMICRPVLRGILVIWSQTLCLKTYRGTRCTFTGLFLCIYGSRTVQAEGQLHYRYRSVCFLFPGKNRSKQKQEIEVRTRRGRWAERVMEFHHNPNLPDYT